MTLVFAVDNNTTFRLRVTMPQERCSYESMALGSSIPRGIVAFVTVALLLLLASLAAAHPRQVSSCGSCTFWVDNGTLSKSGACEDDCVGDLRWNLRGKRIRSIAEGAFIGLPRVSGLWLSGNALSHLPHEPGALEMPSLR